MSDDERPSFEILHDRLKEALANARRQHWQECPRQVMDQMFAHAQKIVEEVRESYEQEKIMKERNAFKGEGW